MDIIHETIAVLGKPNFKSNFSVCEPFPISMRIDQIRSDIIAHYSYLVSEILIV